jgi:hypothetical protein
VNIPARGPNFTATKIEGDEAKQVKAAVEKILVNEKEAKEQQINQGQPASAKTPDPTDTADMDEVQLGAVTVKIGKPSKAEAADMQLKSRTIRTPGGSKTYENPNFEKEGKEDLKARDSFIESIGVMNTDPKASAFVLQHWGKSKNPQIGFEEVKDGGKVTNIRMYAIGEDGKRIGYSNGGEQSAQFADEVSADFYTAYKDMLKTKDKVNSKYGVKIIPPKQEAQQAAANPWDKVQNAEVRTVVQQARADVQAGKITKEEAARRIMSAQAAVEEKVLVDDKYKIEPDKEEEARKSTKKAEQKAEIEKQIAMMEKQLDGDFDYGETQGKFKNLDVTQWFSDEPRRFPLSKKRRDQMIVMRSNLKKKLKELE